MLCIHVYAVQSILLIQTVLCAVTMRRVAPLFLLILDLVVAGRLNHFEARRRRQILGLYNSSLLRSSPGISQTGNQVEALLSVVAELYVSCSYTVMGCKVGTRLSESHLLVPSDRELT